MTFLLPKWRGMGDGECLDFFGNRGKSSFGEWGRENGEHREKLWLENRKGWEWKVWNVNDDGDF